MTKLFKDIYYVKCTDWTYLGKPYMFVHRCTDFSYDIRILSSGKCNRCKKFILPYKKLEVMRALKELNG